MYFGVRYINFHFNQNDKIANRADTSDFTHRKKQNRCYSSELLILNIFFKKKYFQEIVTMTLISNIIFFNKSLPTTTILYFVNLFNFF